MKVGALGVGGVAAASPNTPVTLAAAAYAYESLEVASYRLLRSLAERANDPETGGCGRAHPRAGGGGGRARGRDFDRVLDLSLGEPAVSP